MFGEGLTICKINSAPNLFVTYDVSGVWSRLKSRQCNMIAWKDG